jgi:hypothetical protein
MSRGSVLNTRLIIGTIVELEVRKQRYKLTMFTRLYRILWLTVVVIAIFFVVSSLSFSERLAEGRFIIFANQINKLMDGRLRSKLVEVPLVAT